MFEKEKQELLQKHLIRFFFHIFRYIPVLESHSRYGGSFTAGHYQRREFVSAYNVIQRTAVTECTHTPSARARVSSGRGIKM